MPSNESSKVPQWELRLSGDDIGDVSIIPITVRSAMFRYLSYMHYMLYGRLVGRVWGDSGPAGAPRPARPKHRPRRARSREPIFIISTLCQVPHYGEPRRPPQPVQAAAPAVLREPRRSRRPSSLGLACQASDPRPQPHAVRAPRRHAHTTSPTQKAVGGTTRRIVAARYMTPSPVALEP